MRSSWDVRWAVLAIAVLGFAAGGCGSLTGKLVQESSLLASRTPAASLEAPAPAPAVASATASETPAQTEGPAVEATPAAQTAEPTAADPVTIDYAPITAANAPTWVVALAGPLNAAVKGSTDSDASDLDVDEFDPWESFNEKMFAFNYNLDKYVLKPVAQGYNFIVPDMFQTMIDNAFFNLRMPSRFVNKILQWRLADAGKEMGRFLVNSTLGIGGLFDVAKQEMNLPRNQADFGQTLGVWGVHPGPFLILPFMPPLTVRDGIGYGVDGAMHPLYYYIAFWPDAIAMKLGDTVNDRSLSLDLFQGIEQSTVDLYSAVRNAYLQRRARMIKEVLDR